MSGAAPDHPVRVLFMDTHRLFASALEAKLEQDPRFEIVGIAHDGDELVELARDASPDVVLLDANMPDGDTVGATRVISAGERPPQVLIMAGADDEFDAVEAHDAGAAAFLRRPRSAADLVETLELATALIQATVTANERAET